MDVVYNHTALTETSNFNQIVPGYYYRQTKDGKFTQQSVNYKSDPQKKEIELGTLLFDADGDGDLDLYIVRGGYVYEAQSPLYQDIICINNGFHYILYIICSISCYIIIFFYEFS